MASVSIVDMYSRLSSPRCLFASSTRPSAVLSVKKEITKILFDQGYILSYKFEDNSVQGSIKIALKYDKDTKESVIKDIQRISKPGLRKYAGASKLPRILNGLGIAIVSTSKGLMTGKQAKQLNVGGEVICYVY